MRLSMDDVIYKYKENIFRAALSISRNPQDAEDILQDTLLEYFQRDREFDSEEHIKAWLLRVATNKSKNIVLNFWHRNRVSLEEYMEEVPFQEPEDRKLAEAVLSLPKKYRIIIHLYYYEDYSVREIGDVLNLTQSAVKNRLLRGRKMLKEMLKEEWADE